MTKSSFLAVIRMSVGGGSFHRADDADKAATAAIKQFRRDWGRMFDIPKGHEFSVAIYDVTGMGDLTIGSDGVFDTDNKAVPVLRVEKRKK